MDYEGVSRRTSTVEKPKESSAAPNHHEDTTEPSKDKENADLTATSQKSKPIMYTFYEKVGGVGEDDLIQVWKDEWQAIGFDTQILTMEDAKKHPLYDEMETAVRPIFGSSYNAFCFYRWLAMASTGGGWMSDYDTFPTNFPIEEATKLPNDGTLTSFELHVPSLISGTKEEWTRTCKLLIEAIPRTKGFASDMLVFKTIREDRNSGIHFLSPERHMQHGFHYNSPRKVNCEQMKIGRAVHLSHTKSRDAVHAGLFPVELDEGVDEATHRAEACKVFMMDWRAQCVEGGTSQS